MSHFLDEPLDFLKKSDIGFPGGKDASVTIRNPFKKRPEKKAAQAPAPAARTSTYRPPAVDPVVYSQPVYTESSRSDDCTPSSSHHSSTSHDSGGSYGGHSSHSSYSSHDSGSSHSFSSHDSGSSSCDGGGGF